MSDQTQHVHIVLFSLNDINCVPQRQIGCACNDLRNQAYREHMGTPNSHMEVVAPLNYMGLSVF
jgi:hypothetical protein